MTKNSEDPRLDPAEFDLAQRAEADNVSVVRELFAFVRQEKKWFLIPILVILLLAGLFVVLSGTAVAPLIYTVF